MKKEQTRLLLLIGSLFCQHIHESISAGKLLPEQYRLDRAAVLHIMDCLFEILDLKM